MGHADLNVTMKIYTHLSEKNALIQSAFQAFLGVNRIQNAVKTMLLVKNLVRHSIKPLQICNIKSKIFNLRL